MTDEPTSEPETGAEESAESPAPDEAEFESASGPELFPKVGIKELLEQAHRTVLETFEKEVASGNGEWAKAKIPAAVALLESTGITVTDELLLRIGETRAFWVGIEERLGQCARCGAGQAVCRGTSSSVQDGMRVSLAVLGPDQPKPTVHRQLQHCEKYRDAWVTERLIAAGVDRRWSRVRLSYFGTHEIRARASKAGEFLLEMLKSKTEATLLIQGRDSTLVGIALMAEYVALGVRPVRAEHVPTLVRLEKDAMRNKTGNVFIELVLPRVLLLDGIDQSLMSSKHWLDEVLWLLNRRTADQLCTILTTTITNPKLKDTFPGARVLPMEKKS